MGVWPVLVGAEGEQSTILASPIIGSMPTRHWWDVDWRKEHHHDVFKADPRPGAEANNVWWTGDGGQVGWVIYAYESLWMPTSLLKDDSQDKLANALFAASRHGEVELHFNKGLAGAPPDAIFTWPISAPTIMRASEAAVS